MEAKELFEKLKEGAGLELEFENGRWHGFGAINRFEECKVGRMTQTMYDCVHYPEKQAILESLPWVKVVVNPRNPKPGEYPTENGEYITMLDCNEHELLINTFKDGIWSLYHKTHIKWWMHMPDMTDYKIENE